MTDEKSTAELLMSIIAAGADPINMDRYSGDVQPSIIVPNDCRIESLEEFLPSPVRVRQKNDMHTVESFLHYWKRFHVPEVSIVMADQEAMRFTAYIDYHESSDPYGASYCDHQAYYRCPMSEEWKLWLAHNNKRMDQATFSQFIEDNIDDIGQRDGAGPTGAEMLEVATGLEVKKNVQFKSSNRLDNGQVLFTYNEEVQGSDRTGQMSIPQEFYLVIPVFKNDAPYSVKARLRYRMSNGQVAFWYDLYRTDKVLDDAFGRVYTRIETAVEADNMYMAKVVSD